MRKERQKRSRANEGDVHIASRVRGRRIQIGMSQTELGTRVGVTFQQIQKYEKGTNRIGSSRLHQIAGALEVGAEYFFDDPFAQLTSDVERVGKVEFDAFCASKDGTALMQAFVTIADKGVQRAIAALVAELSD